MQTYTEHMRFSALWGQRDRVMRFVRGRGVDPHTADDVVAGVFLVAWRRLEDVPDAEDAAVAWLCGVARHALRNHRRSGHRQHRLVERTMAVWPSTPALGAGSIDTRWAAMQALSALSPDDRGLLFRSGWDGAGLDELASELGCSRAAAAQRLSRARRRLDDAFAAFA